MAKRPNYNRRLELSRDGVTYFSLGLLYNLDVTNEAETEDEKTMESNGVATPTVTTLTFSIETEFYQDDQDPGQLIIEDAYLTKAPIHIKYFPQKLDLTKYYYGPVFVTARNAASGVDGVSMPSTASLAVIGRLGRQGL